METLFYEKKGKERGDHEYSPNVAGGGRSNVPSVAVIGGICRVPIMDVERVHPDSVKPYTQCNPKYCLLYEPKCNTKVGLPKMENMKNEKQFVQEQRLKFI